MLKRLSTLRGRNKKEEANGVPNGQGAHAANGHANGVQVDGTKSEANGTSKPMAKRMSFARPKKRDSHENQGTDRSVTRGDVDSSFQQFQQLIHASSRPLPTQTGDGSYIEQESSSTLMQELRTLGFKDFKTLREVITSKASGALTDDKTMIMERVIQVSRVRYRVRTFG